MRTGAISWLTRSDLRHRLQQLHSEALELRASLLKEHLDAEGIITEINMWIGDLTYHREVIAREIRSATPLPPPERCDYPACGRDAEEEIHGKHWCNPHALGYRKYLEEESGRD